MGGGGFFIVMSTLEFLCCLFDELQSHEVISSPAGLIANHGSERLRPERISRAMKGDSDAPAVRMSVALVTAGLRAEREPITVESTRPC